jgi:hypothetical protein
LSRLLQESVHGLWVMKRTGRRIVVGGSIRRRGRKDGLRGKNGELVSMPSQLADIIKSLGPWTRDV